MLKSVPSLIIYNKLGFKVSARDFLNLVVKGLFLKNIKKIYDECLGSHLKWRPKFAIPRYAENVFGPKSAIMNFKKLLKVDF